MIINQKYFNAGDYTVFFTIILLQFIIGVYYAFFAKQRSQTVSHYLVGNRNMNVFPVAMSMAATFISTPSMIGPISEIYFYGIQYIIVEIAKLAASLFGANVYIPVYHKLKLTSVYEYLGIRFGNKIRILGTVLFIMQVVMFCTIATYLPALLFEHMMGIPYEILVPVVAAICIFYTSFGGILAIVWTDTIQMIVMLTGMFIFAILGMYNVGDLKKLWRVNEQGGRTKFFNMDPNPTLTHTFWTILVGGFFNILAIVPASQFTVQRCAALSSLKKINIAILMYVTVAFLLKSSILCIALSIYATFHGCDPITSGKISKPDQLLPFFMMHLKDQIPLLPSIVISAMFCASLSTTSSALNSVAGVILIDIIKPLYRKPIAESRGALIMKLIIIVVGIISTGLAFTLDLNTGLLQFNFSLIAMSSGPMLGVLTLGVLFPWSNSIGALVGGISGGVFVGWITIGAQIAIRNKQIVNPKLPLSIEDCDNATNFNYYELLNQTRGNVTKLSPGEPFPLYRISFMYFGFLATVTVIVVGMIASYFTGFNNPSEMDPKLFSPIIQPYLKRKRDQNGRKQIMEAEINL